MNGGKCGKCDIRHACGEECENGNLNITSIKWGMDTIPYEMNHMRTSELLKVKFRKCAAPMGCKTIADVSSSELKYVETPLWFEVVLEMPDGTEHRLGKYPAEKQSSWDSSTYSHYGIITPNLVRHGNHHLKVTARDDRGIIHAVGFGRVCVKDCGG